MVLSWLTLLSVKTFAVASQGIGGGFGWFAFSDTHTLPLFEVTPCSFRVRSEHAKEIFFSEDAEGIHCPRLSRYRKIVALAPRSRSPFRVVLELASLGFSMEFRDGVRLMGSGDPPMLSWGEGSVGVGIPTPAVRWVLLTWKEPQPPLLLSLSEGACAWIVRRVGSSFVIETVDRYAGWVRVQAPFGRDEMVGATARDLGMIQKKLKPRLPTLLAGEPNLVDVRVTLVDGGFTVTWRFDKPGALVPIPLLSREGGFPVKLVSSVEPATLEALPSHYVSKEKDIRAYFSVVELYPGRPVVQSTSQIVEGPATLSHIDAPSVCELALAYLAGLGDEKLVRAMDTAFTAFIRDQPHELEPRTGLRFYFSRDGRGSRLAAAYALVEMALRGEGEGLLGLLGSLDWLTWLPMGSTNEERLEAGAIASVAAALSPSPDVRVLGAMANAGVCWYGLQGGELMSTQTSWESFGPLWDVRARVYPSAVARQGSPAKWWEALRYPVRCLTSDVICVGEGRDILVMGFVRPFEIMELRFRSPYSLVPVGRVGVELRGKRSFGREHVFILRIEREKFRLRLRLPPNAALPPASGGGLRYNGVLR